MPFTKSPLKKEKTSNDGKTRHLGITIDPDKTYVFETIEKSSTPRHEVVGTYCKMYDALEGRYREMRYVPIADSVFVDEQDESLKGYPDEALFFSQNQFIVDGKNVRLMEFMLLHENYDGNKNRLSRRPPVFTLVDRDKYEQAKSDNYDRISLALESIKSRDIKDLMPIARVLLNVMDEEEIIIRNILRDKALEKAKGPNEESGADVIINNISSPELLRRYFVQKAVDDGIIVFDIQNGVAKWKDTSVTICNLSNLKSTDRQVKEVVSYSFEREGKEFWDFLLTQVGE